MNPIMTGLPMGVIAGLLVIAATCAILDWMNGDDS